MRFGLAFALSALAWAVEASEPPVVAWEDLPDAAAQDFHDPFAALGYEALMDLRAYVTITDALAGGSVEAETRPGLEARLAKAVAALQAGGVDPEALLAQRWEIAERRERAATLGNATLDGTEAALFGFFIPDLSSPEDAPMAYLVPEMGMCSHVPPPPPNMLVRLRLAEDDESLGFYDPVEVRGTLRLEASSASVYVLDGMSAMESSWTLDTDVIRPLGMD